MILYLIRHGRTDAYENNFRQSPSTPLGEYGLNQAKKLAEKLKKLKIDHLYSSDWPRAVQTAEMVSQAKKLEVKIHPHIHENDKHPSLDNALLDGEVNKRYLKEREENKYDFDWKFDGKGESVNDLISRAEKVIKFLISKHSKDSVAIVSHAIFLEALVGVILLGRNVDKHIFSQFIQSVRIDNASITSLKYFPEKKVWHILTLNDHCHLSDNWLSNHNG